MLNADFFTLQLNDSDKCLCDRPETVTHFLHHCFLYQNERHVLQLHIRKLIPKFDILHDNLRTEVLLKGVNLSSNEPDSRNLPIALAVQNFILKTKRFN